MTEITPDQFASWSVFVIFAADLTWKILVAVLLWRILNAVKTK
jgi:hypothetical protein